MDDAASVSACAVEDGASVSACAVEDGAMEAVDEGGPVSVGVGGGGHTHGGGAGSELCGSRSEELSLGDGPWLCRSGAVILRSAHVKSGEQRRSRRGRKEQEEALQVVCTRHHNADHQTDSKIQPLFAPPPTAAAVFA